LLAKIKDIFTSKYGAKKNATIYLFASFSSFGISILTLPVFTRLLSPADFGNTVLFVMIGKLVIGFVNFNLHFASYKYYFNYIEDQNKFNSLNSTNIIFLLIVFLSTLLIGKYLSSSIINIFFKKEFSETFVLLSILSGFLDYFFLYFTTILTAQLRAVNFALLTISSVLLNSLFSVLYIIEFKLSFWGRIYGILTAQVLVLIIAVYLCRNTLTWKVNIGYLKKSLKLTSPMIPQMFLGISQNYLDKSILSYSKGASSLGYYSLGVNFSTILKTIMDAVEKAWSPLFFKSANENSEESKSEIAKSFMSLAFIYMIIGLAVIYFSEEAIKILTTKQYYVAINIVPIYVYFYLFAIFGYLSNAQLSVSEKLKYILPGAFMGAIVNLVLNFILIPKIGPIGAAVSSAITALITQIVMFHFGMKHFPIPIRISKIVALYFVLFLFTSFFYIILPLDIHIIIKIFLKLFLITLFILYGFWIKVLNKKYLITILNNKYLNLFFNRVKH
jgi:O-antigen/teichoic acid export membrane protein